MILDTKVSQPHNSDMADSMKLKSGNMEDGAILTSKKVMDSEKLLIVPI